MQAQHNFRANLRAAMAFRGVSQRELATLSGLAFTQINRILQGKNGPTLQSAERIARAVGFPLVSLLAAPSEFADCLPEKISA